MAYSETALKVYNKLYFRNGDDNDPHNVHARVAEFAGSKLDKARKLGIRMINENEFKTMI